MNELIIGGFITIGLLVLLGLALVLRNEKRARIATRERARKQAELERKLATKRKIIDALPLGKQTLPVPSNTNTTDAAQSAGTKEDLYEIAIGLHTLYQQTQELEHRLSIMTSVVELIEHSMDRQTTAHQKILQIPETPPSPNEHFGPPQ